MYGRRELGAITTEIGDFQGEQMHPQQNDLLVETESPFLWNGLSLCAYGDSNPRPFGPQLEVLCFAISNLSK
jgi:hypothetical protein